jgi:hypothetical protein
LDEDEEEVRDVEEEVMEVADGLPSSGEGALNDYRSPDGSPEGSPEGSHDSYTPLSMLSDRALDIRHTVPAPVPACALPEASDGSFSVDDAMSDASSSHHFEGDQAPAEAPAEAPAKASDEAGRRAVFECNPQLALLLSRKTVQGGKAAVESLREAARRDTQTIDALPSSPNLIVHSNVEAVMGEVSQYQERVHMLQTILRGLPSSEEMKSYAPVGEDLDHALADREQAFDCAQETQGVLAANVRSLYWMWLVLKQRQLRTVSSVELQTLDPPPAELKLLSDQLRSEAVATELADDNLRIARRARIVLDDVAKSSPLSKDIMHTVLVALSAASGGPQPHVALIGWRRSDGALLVGGLSLWGSRVAGGGRSKKPVNKKMVDGTSLQLAEESHTLTDARCLPKHAGSLQAMSGALTEFVVPTLDPAKLVVREEDLANPGDWAVLLRRTTA